MANHEATNAANHEATNAANKAAHKEQISALVDGELQDKVLLEQLSSEPALADTFARYHLYGDALRNDLPTHLHLDLSDNILAALADEAPHSVSTISTGSANAQSQDSAEQAVASNVVRGRFGRLAPMMRYAGQFAIAASVSAALIVGVQQYSQQDMQSPVLNTIPLSGSATPVSLNYRAQSQQPTNEQVLLEQQRRIHELLMDHELQQRLRQH
ncbi:sigma-E factor negative regulatory protein [Oceanisphaera sp. IT1-181]|uniref:sigma-E factor negative regulatory protein n=1 Tax=Oceanisphaera sp. IT1-181 TaxID=3081199 RepID=UPI0029C9B5D4|nr:RseA family anti-sigma factor [Oceanisphaera sp. IT1-181]